MHSSTSVLLPGALFLFVVALLSPGPPDLSPPEPAPARGGSGTTSNAPVTFRKDVREVTISFIASDEDGRRLTGLRPQEVRVLSDGLPVPYLTGFYSERTLPLRLTILVDTSDSVTPDFLSELNATDQFTSRLVRPGVDQISWNGFASRLEHYPDNSASLRPATFGRYAIGQTALYDAVYETVRREANRAPDNMRKALILLSDGEDNWSRRTLDDAIEAAQSAGFTIYCLTAHDSDVEPPGDAALRRLASSTGGRAYILSSYDHVTNVLEEVEKDLRSQFLLSFIPPMPVCGVHTVKVVSVSRAFDVQSRNAYLIDGC